MAHRISPRIAAWTLTMALAGTMLMTPAQAEPSAPLSIDNERAQFAPCGKAKRITCVVDGDTFWYRGAKYRIADINTPETHQPACSVEKSLGQRATVRLIALLNAGNFSLGTGSRDTDRYGRKLRIVMRGGISIGKTLVDEGLAEEWQGKRGDWCSNSVL